MTSSTDRLNTALAGRYRIEKQLGQGGMATVYLAHDEKHDRKVAVKVLKPELAAVLGAERFVVEIKTTAALQHPHILPLFDSGSADGFLYYVMPYIEGETLRGKLNRETQFSVDDAVRITTQVADALDYAHRHGVIHRDIKPENILLHDGRPMVSDFGIALAVSAAAGGRMTETGLSLGTPHYMSPEQATADKDITGRSDIYSLASVTYEMLTGNPPHVGSSAQQIIMKIIAEQVEPVTKYRKAVPPNVAAALAQALEKLPADRFETAKAFAEALVNRTFTSATFAGDLPGVVGRSRIMTRPFIAAVAIALIATAVAVAGWLRPSTTRQVSRYRVVFPTDQEPVIVGQGQMAWAPDESWIVYTGPGAGGRTTQLWVKQRDRVDATPLSGTAGALGPSVSPDGRMIAFTLDNMLRTVPAGGGPTTMLADSAWPGLTALWLEDGSVVYTDAIARLRRVGAGGGTAELLHSPPQGFGAVPADELPSGRGILFLRCSLGCTPVSELWVLDGRSGETRQVYPEASWAQYHDGLLLYTVRDGTTYGVPFDLGTLAPRGAPIPLFAGVRVDQGASIALTPRGSMMYVAGAGVAIRSELVWVDRDGRSVPVDTGWRFIPGVNPGLALSPDGKRVAVGVREDLNSDIWVKDLPDGPVSRITRDSALDIRPRWAPGGAHLTFLSNRIGAYQPYVTRADGIGVDSLMFRYERQVFDAAISRDGRWELFRVGTGQNTDIVARQRGVDSVPRNLLAESFGEHEPALSPDGRWLAYVSSETGREEVFIRPFPNVNGGKWKVSDGGGISPVWARSGRELFYLDQANGFISQAVAPGATFQRGVHRKLFTVPARHTRLNTYANFDVSPDDRRFLFIMNAGDSGPAESPALIVVENWMAEVKRIVKERAR